MPASCKECKDVDVDLYKDRNDGLLYCAKCWKVYYNRKAPASAKVNPNKAEEIQAAADARGKGKGPKGKVDKKTEKPKDKDEHGNPLHPIAGEEATVDDFYEGAERYGEPKIVMERGVAWTVMMKAMMRNEPRVWLQQLIEHDGTYIFYVRQGRIGSQMEESYEDFTNPRQAKDKFAAVFFERTGNTWHIIKNNFMLFVAKRDKYTLLQDTKAARREENETNRLAKQQQLEQEEAQRNAEIAAATRQALGLPVESPAEPAQEVQQVPPPAAATPAPSAAPTAAAPATAPATNGAAPYVAQRPPPTPAAKPAPSPALPGAKPAATTAAPAATPAPTAATPAPAPAARKVVEDEPSSSMVPLAIGVAVIAAAVVGAIVVLKKK